MSPLSRRAIYWTYPLVPIVVVVRRPGGGFNALSVAWNTWVSFEPPLFLVAIGLERYSYGLISKEKEFTVNVLPLEKAHLYTLFGRTSGRDRDKFREFSVEISFFEGFQTPRLKDAVAAYACSVKEEIPAGDHALFLAEVVDVFLEGELFDPKGPPDLARYSPSLYLGKNQYLKVKKHEVLSIDLEEALSLLKGDSKEERG